MSTVEVAREWLSGNEDEIEGPGGGWFVVQSRAAQNIASLAALLDAQRSTGFAAGVEAGKREAHVRLRETLLHPTVRDVPIPAAIWHVLRNLEHETGDLPIGWATGRESEGLRYDAAQRKERDHA